MLAAAFPEFVDPNPAAGNQFGATVLALSTGNVVITSPFDDFGGTDAGAVYLFNGATGALINTLRGTSANDNVGLTSSGFGGVTALTNGNFVVSSLNWDLDATNTNAGAVTFGDGTTGFIGAVAGVANVSGTNSLIGSRLNDSSNGGVVTPLTNGNYVVTNSFWDLNASVVNVGAATLGSGTTGVSGSITNLNSLIGSTADDRVGSGGVTALTNDNYVVSSNAWNLDATHTSVGAVTWGDGDAGINGAVTTGNSLVGSTSGDGIGANITTTQRGVVALTNGNYVVRSGGWDLDATHTNVGAVTWRDGSTGTSDTVSSGNSLVGSTTGDAVGGINGVLTVLPNGNYVVVADLWTLDATHLNVGAATFGDGLTGVKGAITSGNSLIGSRSDDRVGSAGVRVLTNGNYVVTSNVWDLDATHNNVGAVTWGSKTAGVSGAVSSGNSLVGSTTEDRIGEVGGGAFGPVALANGNYVVIGTLWDLDATHTNVGAVTWGDGAMGTNGTVSSGNSLVGSTTSDAVGRVTALPSGNYLVSSNLWDLDATHTDVGAVTFGNGAGGTNGAVSSGNSLIGATTGDQVGTSVTALTNDKYVVSSPFWDLDASHTNVGAATFGNGTTVGMGAVTSGNSLIGSTGGDNVGFNGAVALANGNYVVRSANWDLDATHTNVGAVTWGDGAAGIIGTVSSGNSLIGGTTNDNLGAGGAGGVIALSNGNYVVNSTLWDNVGFVNAGAVTFGNGTGGVSGSVDASNSALGQAATTNLQAVVLDNVNEHFFGRFLAEGGGRVRVGSQVNGFAASSTVVTNANDSGAGSLRAAIESANATAGLQTITFAIPGAGVHTITPVTPLPEISDAVVIDGTTQGASATPLIELDGTIAGAGALGLKIKSGGSTVRGLAINRFNGAGIRLVTGSGNILIGNFIGTNAAGSADLGNAGDGVQIINSDNNTIGGNNAADLNLISGNDRFGVSIDVNSTGNVVKGNLIGTNLAGTGDLGNTLSGVLILSASNTIGGTAAGARNIISGNDQHGVYLTTAAVTSNLVQGNYIGTDINGTADLGNSQSGVQIDAGAASNTIGGTTAAARNVISGNNGYGVRLQTFGTTTNNNVQGNYIGTSVNGTAAIGNSLSGVQVNATGNTIGGTVAGAGNVISGNVQHGVLIQGGINVANLVQGNLIGTSASGAADLGNAQSGVQVLNSSGNTIGGTTASARNIISGNNENGIHLLGSGTTTTTVQGNYIGTDVNGTADLGNMQSGVQVTTANNTIGGTAAGARNVISGNDRFGIAIQGSAATGNNVQGNLIGTNAAGTGAVGNSFSGITLYDAGSNTIGGTTVAARNVISGNLQNGVYLSQTNATNNVIAGNFIGTNINGNVDLGNILDGVLLDARASSNTIGGTVAGARNLISGNNQNGIHLVGFGGVGVGTRSNLIQGNYIGTDAGATTHLMNSLNGVMVQATANTIGGTALGAGNLISGNNRSGVLLQGGVSAGTLVQGNRIGTDVSGTVTLANLEHGVEIVHSSGNSVGGTAAGSGNTIAFNPRDGVSISGTDASASNNAILRNSIFSNGDLGIDLNNEFVTPNDVDDPDLGSNHLQNFPEFVSVVKNGANLDITYSVPSLTTNSAYPLRIEFYIADALNQEGKTILGAVSYASPGTTLATVSAGAAVVGTKIVATATDANGNTSEFSLFATVASPA
ncbi:MAG: hypothetical protein AABP62_22825 [Planctomycetota bacterium]